MQITLRKTLCLFCTLLLALLAAAGLAATEGQVVGGNLHLRAGPSEDADILATYEAGTQVTILNTEGDFYQVSLSNGHEGYMESRYVMVGDQGRVDTKGEAYVNLRAEPSASADILGQFTEGTTLTLLSGGGTRQWAYVSIEGMDGYLLTRFIGATPVDIAPTPTDAADAEAPYNPFLLDTSGSAAVVHQVGESASKVSLDAGFQYTISYPDLGIAAADQALADWIAGILAQGDAMAGEVPAGDVLELTVQYDAYLVADRYIGVLETGSLGSTASATPTDVLFTMNVDKDTGALLDMDQIWVSDRAEDVLTLLAEELAKMRPHPFDGETAMDASWLGFSLVTSDGIAILLPKGEFLDASYGTLQVVLSYQQLEENGLLALSLVDYTPPEASGEHGDAAPPDLPSRAEIDPSRPMVALTFDDGPSDHTDAILDVLATHGGRATFCVIGNRTSNYRDVLQRVVTQGSEVATHTWSHKDLTKLSPDAITNQLQQSMDAIAAITGQPVTVLRPPYGAVNHDVHSICRRLGLTIATWSLDTEDWKTQNADSTYAAILRHVKNGSIILCHDSHLSTANAMKRVVPDLVEKGYQLVTVSELLSFSETHGEAGRLYNHLDVRHLEATE